MKRTIYDCWKCRHHNSDNPYGIDYCEVHDTRCSFTYDDCDDFAPDDDGNDRKPEPTCHLTLIGWYLLAIVFAVLLGWLLMGCTTTKYVSVPEVHEHWHHSTDTIHKTDSFIDRQTTTIREVDSATMAVYGVQMKQMQRAWLVETDRLRQVISELRMTKHDTVHELDSIPYPVEVVREVERGHTFGEMMLIALAVTAVVLLLVFARKV